VRPLLAAVACVLAGLAVGAVWTWAQGDRYRADARVLVRPASARIVPAVEALAESSLVESNVAQTLRLSSPPDISAKRGDSGVLTVSVEAGGRERARQIDAEVVVILTQKVEQRFGTVGVTATVLDPAHAAEQTSPTPGRNLLITGLIGLFAGGAAAAALMRQRPAPLSGAGDPHVERRLRARIDEVAKRERALARRAGELAAREQALERGQAESAAPPPAPEPAPEPAPAPPPPITASGGWNLEQLEARVEAQADAFPDRVDEWRSYLFFLRDHADIDGRLPSNFDALVAEVFEPLFR
jgi:hypothetical protein